MNTVYHSPDGQCLTITIILSISSHWVQVEDCIMLSISCEEWKIEDSTAHNDLLSVDAIPVNWQPYASFFYGLMYTVKIEAPFVVKP